MPRLLSGSVLKITQTCRNDLITTQIAKSERRQGGENKTPGGEPGAEESVSKHPDKLTPEQGGNGKCANP